MILYRPDAVNQFRDQNGARHNHPQIFSSLQPATDGKIFSVEPVFIFSGQRFHTEMRYVLPHSTLFKASTMFILSRTRFVIKFTNNAKLKETRPAIT